MYYVYYEDYDEMHDEYVRYAVKSFYSLVDANNYAAERNREEPNSYFVEYR